jgi:hypothetical protein
MCERLPQGEYRTYLGVLLKNKFAKIGLTFAVITALAGCGSSGSVSSDNGVAPAADASESTCFTALNAQQKAELTQYANEHKDEVSSSAANSDGTQDICVLESNSAGGYDQHYYKKEDNFNDYLLYSLMFGRSNALLAYGLITNDLDVSQYMALSLLTGVNRYGQTYHPYTHNGNNWGRSTSWSDTSRVDNVRYGSSSPVLYSQAKTMPYPAGYKPVPLTFQPGTENAVAAVKKGADGKVTVTKVPNANAQDTLKAYPRASAPAVPTKSQTTTTGSGNTNATTPAKSATKTDTKSDPNTKSDTTKKSVTPSKTSTKK